MEAVARASGQCLSLLRNAQSVSEGQVICASTMRCYKSWGMYAGICSRRTEFGGPARAELKWARSKLHEQGTAPHRSLGGGGHLSRSPYKWEFCGSCGAGRGADGGSNRGARHGWRGTASHRYVRQWRALASPALHDDGACVWDRFSNGLEAD